jgi:hypothetical protein
MWMIRSGRRPSWAAAYSSRITGRVSRTVAYATGMGDGWTWREMRRSSFESSASLHEKVNEGGREEAIRKEALTRLVLKGWRGVRVSLRLT